MISLLELNNFLLSIYNPHSFVDYCINGLCIDCGKSNITKVCTCVTVNEKSINFAVDQSADIIISHHPLLWKSDDFLFTGSLSRKISKIYENKISVFTFHFPMDAHVDLGNNWPVAKRLGLTDLSPIFKDNSCGMFWGVFGKFEIEKTVSDIIFFVENFYSVKPRVAYSNLNSNIKSVAICSGGSHRFFDEAIKFGCDCYICGTGDISQFDRAIEDDKLFISVGHFASERVGPKLLCDFINHKLDVECIFFDEQNMF